MDLLKQFSDVFSAAGKKARQAYDHTKLEMRIKGYEKELREAYAEIGRMMYRSHKSNVSPDNEKLNELFVSIDNVTFRIHQLSKAVQEMKKQGDADKLAKAEPQTVDAADMRAFAKLARKEGDLKIRRTADGIQVLRLCSACGYGNAPSAEACVGCGYSFKAKEAEAEPNG